MISNESDGVGPSGTGPLVVLTIRGEQPGETDLRLATPYLYSRIDGRTRHQTAPSLPSAVHITVTEI